MNIKIKKHFLYYKDYKLKCAVGKSGITNNKKEGDLSTPKGTYKINALYYRKDKIKKFKCKINQKVIKRNMGWCDDINSNKYNNNIYCGGGGGYKGGKAFSYNKKIENINYPYKYVYGIGGTSYIKNLNVETNLFKHDYNNSNGYAIIYHMT